MLCVLVFRHFLVSTEQWLSRISPRRKQQGRMPFWWSDGEKRLPHNSTCSLPRGSRSAVEFIYFHHLFTQHIWISFLFLKTNDAMTIEQAQCLSMMINIKNTRYFICNQPLKRIKSWNSTKCLNMYIKCICMNYGIKQQMLRIKLIKCFRREKLNLTKFSSGSFYFRSSH